MPRNPDATLARLRADPQWQARLLAELARRAPETDDQLHAWVWHLLGFQIARRAVCPEHQAPFQFLADLYFGRVQQAVALGPRGGGKTRLVSILEWLVACRQPVEIFHAGAVAEQAQRCYDYVKSYVALPHFQATAMVGNLAPLDPLVQDSLMSRTSWANGSRLEIHSATLNQLSGSHPFVKCADEVDKWGAAELRQLYGMGTQEGAQTVLTSTRESATGLMQTVLDEASKRRMTVYSWCVFETKQPCLECLQSACALWDDCQGKYKDSDGHRSRKNIEEKRLLWDDDTWEAQGLCRRPGRQGLCFPRLVTEPGEPDQSNVTEAAEFDASLPVELWCDDNTAQCRAIAMAQCDALGRLHIFDEYYLPGRLQSQSVQEVLDRLRERGKFPEVAVVPLEATELKIAFHAQDVDTASPRDYRRAQGVAVVNRFICTANGQRNLLIHPRCVNFIDSLRIAFRKEISPGVYDEEPVKHSKDHPQDATMYGCWHHRFVD